MSELQYLLDISFQLVLVVIFYSVEIKYKNDPQVTLRMIQWMFTNFLSKKLFTTVPDHWIYSRVKNHLNLHNCSLIADPHPILDESEFTSIHPV